MRRVLALKPARESFAGRFAPAEGEVARALEGEEGERFIACAVAWLDRVLDAPHPRADPACAHLSAELIYFFGKRLGGCDPPAVPGRRGAGGRR